MSMKQPTDAAARRSVARAIGAAAWNGAIATQRFGMAAGGAILVGLIFFESIARYALHLPLMEVEEIAILLAMWTYFLGMGVCSFERSHISAEMLHLFIKGRGYQAIVAVRTVISLCLMFILVRWGSEYFLWGIERGQVSPILRWPMVWSQSAMFVGILLMTFYTAVQLIDEVRKLLGKQPFVRTEPLPAE